MRPSMFSTQRAAIGHALDRSAPGPLPLISMWLFWCWDRCTASVRHPVWWRNLALKSGLTVVKLILILLRSGQSGRSAGAGEVEMATRDVKLGETLGALIEQGGFRRN